MFDGYVPGELVTLDTNTVGIPAGTATISLRPPVGEARILLACTVFHNDVGGNKTLGVTITDGVTDCGLCGISVASGIATGVKVWPDSGLANAPFVMDRGHYLSVTGALIAADKTLIVRAVYRRLIGVYNSV